MMPYAISLLYQNKPLITLSLSLYATMVTTLWLKQPIVLQIDKYNI